MSIEAVKHLQGILEPVAYPGGVIDPIHDVAPLGRWDPLDPLGADAVMRSAPFPWWISGGWAIDLFIGRTTRDHADLDVGVFAADQAAVMRHLIDWELFATDPPGRLRQWNDDELLGPHVTGVWCRRDSGDPWRMQLLLNASNGGDFAYRRDPSIVLPLADAVIHTPAGIPILAPRLQLLFKAKYDRPKDNADFTSVVPLLGGADLAWLLLQLRRLHPGHHWIERLADSSTGVGG